MKVGELISVLMSHDRELDVMLRGYEGGYCVASGVSVKTFLLDVHSEWYYGPHEEAEDYYGNTPDKYESAKGVLVG